MTSATGTEGVTRPGYNAMRPIGRWRVDRAHGEAAMVAGVVTVIAGWVCSWRHRAAPVVSAKSIDAFRAWISRYRWTDTDFLIFARGHPSCRRKNCLIARGACPARAGWRWQVDGPLWPARSRDQRRRGLPGRVGCCCPAGASPVSRARQGAIDGAGATRRLAPGVSTSRVELGVMCCGGTQGLRPGRSRSRCPRRAAGNIALDRLLRPVGAVQPAVQADRRVDEGEVGERLREVADLLAGERDLLRVQAQVVRVGQHLLERLPRSSDLAGAGQRVDVGERAQRERPLRAA